MREVKVQCDCGQKFKFDVEPLNGQMPYTIACPICGADGTHKANAILRQSAPAPAPAGGAAMNLAAMAATQVEKPRLNIQKASPAADAPPPVQATPMRHSSAPPPAPVKSGAAAWLKGEEGQTNLVLGGVGAVVAGVAGLLIWYGLSRYGFYSGWVAWGVGILVGLGGRALGRVGSPALGATTAACALVAILGGEYMWAKGEVDDYHRMKKEIAEPLKSPEEEYEKQLKFAQAVSAAQNDQQLRAILEKEDYLDGEKITDQDLKDFREQDLPELKEFAGGKPSKAEYVAQIQAVQQAAASIGESIDDMYSSPLRVMKDEIVWIGIILALGVSSAFKIGAR